MHCASASDDEELKESIRENGLRDPIEILGPNAAGLSPNTVLDAHRRWRVLEELGEDFAPVVIRHDLAEADRAAVDKFFLERNSLRRQLDQLGKAQLAKALMEIEAGSVIEDLPEHLQDELRERVGKKLGVSGRHVSRLLRILQTPPEVQQAFRERKLPIVLAGQVEGLSKNKQRQLAKRIRDGEEPRSLVESYLGLAKGQPKGLQSAYRKLIGVSRHALEHVGPYIQHIELPPTGGDLKALRNLSELLPVLVERLEETVEEARKQRDAEERELDEFLDELDDQ